MTDPEAARFYRVVEHDPPSPDDFLTDSEAGKLRSEHPDAHGRSVFDDLDNAKDLARRYQENALRRGESRTFRVALIDLAHPHVASGPTISVVQRGRNPHHYQLMGSRFLLARIATIVWDPPRDQV